MSVASSWSSNFPDYFVKRKDFLDTSRGKLIAGLGGQS